MTGLSYWPMAFLTSTNFLDNPDRVNPVFELLGIFLIFCCVLYLAYVASRYIGKKFSAANHSRYIKVVDRVSLGLDKSLLLVKVGAEYYLFLSGKKDFQMVAKVDIENEDIEETAKDNKPNESVFDFREIFDKYWSKDMKKTRINRKSNDGSDPLNKNEVFKENISRLKQMQEKSYDKEE